MSPDAERVARYLESRVTKRGVNGVVFYNKLASNLGFPPVTEAWTSHPLSAIFDEIDNEDHARGAPFRTALVISEATKYPGAGFFKMMLRLRFPNRSNLSDQERMTLFLAEAQALADRFRA